MHSFFSTTSLARFSFFALTLTAAAAAQAATIRVPANKPTIQSAIDVARPGDKILVAPGTYREAIDFLGKPIIVISEAGAAATIIDAESLGKAVATFARGESRKARLSGFTLTHGAGLGWGGGVFIQGASPTIDRNRIVDNVVTPIVGFAGTLVSAGGGIYAIDGAPNIHHNLIARNIANDFGGAIALLLDPLEGLAAEVSDNTIEHNQGGGDGMGGGIYLLGVRGVIARNIIRYNSATMAGGIGDLGSEATVVGNLIHGNTASKNVGGIFASFSATTYANNTVVKNVISSLSGDLASSELQISGRSGVYANNIFYGSSNMPAVSCEGADNLQFDFNDVYTTKVSTPAVAGTCAIGGSNNLSIKPGFTGTGAHPYKLRADSPLINKGDSNAAAGTNLDLLSKPRAVGANVDMGAYELQAN